MPDDPSDNDPTDDDHTDDDIFVLGRRPDADGWTPDDETRHRATRRFALWALAVVAVVVAVSITLVAVLVDEGPSAPASPGAAARQWGRDLVRGDTSARRSLECRGGSRDGTALAQLVTGAASDAHAGRARHHGTDTWRVPIAFVSASGRTEASFTVNVVKQDARYLVC